MAMDDDDDDDDDLDLDLCRSLDKTNDPVRLYLREMGVVLFNAGRRSCYCQEDRAWTNKNSKSIARSPIAVEALIKLGEDLRQGKASIRDTVNFAEQAEISLEEDKADGI